MRRSDFFLSLRGVITFSGHWRAYKMHSRMCAYMSHSLNSLKGCYIGDYIGDYYREY